MKCIVTGGAGFIGSHLVEYLLKNNYDVIVIDNEYSSSNEKFYWNNKCQNYKLDISDYKATRDLYNDVDYVFHCAAEARVQAGIKNPIETIKINTLGTAVVLQCSLEAGVKKVIYSSTSSAYGMNPTPNKETQIPDCLNPYSVSKVSGELLCKTYNDLYGLKTISLRYFNVYGSRQPDIGEFATVIGLFIKQRNNNLPLTVIGDGSQKRDFTHIDDIVEANFIAATKNIPEEYYGNVYNVGYGQNYSIIDIAKTISDNILFIEKRSGESNETLSDNSKFKNMFGWEPKINLKDWLNSMQYQ